MTVAPYLVFADLRMYEGKAALALFEVVAAAYAVVALEKPTPTLTSTIVPGQTVKW